MNRNLKKLAPLILIPALSLLLAQGLIENSENKRKNRQAAARAERLEADIVSARATIKKVKDAFYSEKCSRSLESVYCTTESDEAGSLDIFGIEREAEIENRLIVRGGWGNTYKIATDVETGECEFQNGSTKLDVPNEVCIEFRKGALEVLHMLKGHHVAQVRSIIRTTRGTLNDAVEQDAVAGVKCEIREDHVSCDGVELNQDGERPNVEVYKSDGSLRVSSEAFDGPRYFTRLYPHDGEGACKLIDGGGSLPLEPFICNGIRGDANELFRVVKNALVAQSAKALVAGEDID